jgi:hypothetical protein
LKNGPNDASRVVWALGDIYLLFGVRNGKAGCKERVGTPSSVQIFIKNHNIHNLKT